MPTGERGFAFVVVLVVLALSMLGLSMAGPLWSQQVKRERERELVRIGGLYAQAIARYRALSPGSAKQYPQHLDELLMDGRFVGTVRHLRRLYPDPLTRGQPWVPLRDAQGRIIGVHSSSLDQPVAQGQAQVHGRAMPPVRRYADWRFMVENGA